MKEKINKGHKLHQKYIGSNGIEYPGGSTIAGLLDKGMGMVGSAVKLTKAGYDYKKVWEEKRDAGTVLHGLIESYFTKKPFDTSVYSKVMIGRAENSMIKFYDWEKQHKIEVIETEYQFVNNILRCGGTADLIAKIDDITTLVDYKSGGLYESAFIQTAGYYFMVNEQMKDFDVMRVLLLHLPQTDDDKFEARYLTDNELLQYTLIFKNLCEIYWLRKKVKEDK